MLMPVVRRGLCSVALLTLYQKSEGRRVWSPYGCALLFIQSALDVECAKAGKDQLLLVVGGGGGVSADAGWSMMILVGVV